MSGNSFGTLFKVTTFGESHNKGIGLIIDGLPVMDFDLDYIQKQLDLRRPGKNKYTSARNERDEIEVLSGVYNGKTLGTPLCMMIKNNDQRSKDYSTLEQAFRPGHADITYYNKYGINDPRGGGRSSGRETAARVAAGAVASLYLKNELNIEIKSGISQIYKHKANNDFSLPFDEVFHSNDEKAIELFKEEISNAVKNHDSLPGIIETHITNVPFGLGEPCFDKLDAKLAQAMLSLGACKGFEMGQGFNAINFLGSEFNDSAIIKDGKIAYSTNNAGGVLGGISNSDTIVFKTIFKPTPTIEQNQKTINRNNEEIELTVVGRHDPCIALRAAVVVDAMSAIVLLDMYLINKAYNG